MEFHTRSENETFEVGVRLAGLLERPRVILLIGELGAGKTALTRGLASGLGLRDNGLVHSPTFSLVNQYEIEGSILYHIDLYRLEGSRDFYSIGLQEILEGPAFVVIEWADRLHWRVPDPVEIRIEVDEETDTRSITVSGLLAGGI